MQGLLQQKWGSRTSNFYCFPEGGVEAKNYKQRPNEEQLFSPNYRSAPFLVWSFFLFKKDPAIIDWRKCLLPILQRDKSKYVLNRLSIAMRELALQMGTARLTPLFATLTPCGRPNQISKEFQLSRGTKSASLFVNNLKFEKQWR